MSIELPLASSQNLILALPLPPVCRSFTIFKSALLSCTVVVLGCVITLLVKVFESPAPAHKGTVKPVPDPSNIEELSIFCHSFVLDATTQSPTFQSVIPFKSVAPLTLTI